MLAMGVTAEAQQQVELPAELAAQLAAMQQAVKSVDLFSMVQDARCGQIVVSCLINGQPVRMMLDTGATHTVLHDESAARLQGLQWVDTSKMKFRGNSAQQPRIALGALHVAAEFAPQHAFMVVSLASVRSMMAEQIDGILGMDVLGALPFTFDQAAGKFYWGVPQSARLVPLYGRRDDNGRLMVDVSCKGQVMELLLDTGSSITRVHADRWLPGKCGVVVARLGNVDVASSRTVQKGQPADVELTPGVVVKQLMPIFCPANDRTMLGMDALSNVVLVHLPGAPGNEFGSFFIAK